MKLTAGKVPQRSDSSGELIKGSPQGFDSAVGCVADALDRLHSTAMRRALDYYVENFKRTGIKPALNYYSAVDRTRRSPPKLGVLVISQGFSGGIPPHR